jgi:S-(hydroxymethyl)glutathione dehydrogenase/alcohol dehydrogenase
METSANISLIDLTLMEKQVVGSCFGSGNARADVPRLLELWRAGLLDLDGLVTQRLPLEGVNEGYEAMRNGTAIRTVLVYD